jgi:tetratricopeptide (TPR) repeat protein
MRLFSNVLVVLLGLASAVSASAEQPCAGEKLCKTIAAEKATPQDYRQQLAAAQGFVRNDDFQAAERVYRRIIAHRRFATLSAPEQHAALSDAALTALMRGRDKYARTLYRRAIAIDADNPDDWYRLMQVEYNLGHSEDSAAALRMLAERWPELLVNVDQNNLYQVAGSLASGSKAQVDFLQMLLDAKWIDDEGGTLWFDLALARIQRGEPEQARVAIKAITAPRVVVRLRSDKRFDPFVDQDTWAFNVELASQREVQTLRDRLLAEPWKRAIQIQLSYGMLTAGMNEDVIAFADAVLTEIDKLPTDGSTPEDDDARVWLMNNRAIALRRLGRIDEALSALEAASRLTGNGRISPSQALNLGGLYCSLGRPDDALAAIANAEKMSGFGQMSKVTVELRASILKRDAPATKRALAYLRKHRDSSRTGLLDALVYAGRIEEAAPRLIELLTSEAHRSDALYWLQGYREAEALPGDRDARMHYRALLARADVQAAVARVGRIGNYGIYGVHATE